MAGVLGDNGADEVARWCIEQGSYRWAYRTVRTEAEHLRTLLRARGLHIDPRPPDESAS